MNASIDLATNFLILSRGATSTFQPEIVNYDQQTQGYLLVKFSTEFHGQLFARGLAHSFDILLRLGEYSPPLSINHDLFLDFVYDHMADE